MSAWIRMLPTDQAEGALAEAYELAKTPHGEVANVMRVHSLRPHTMKGHVALYMSVLHHDGNALPTWFLETVASLVSIANRCTYSLTHHWDNARRLIDDEARAAAVRQALDAGQPEDAFAGKELALLRYAHKLTVAPGDMVEADVLDCRAAGATDGEILEVNQVCAYFNYSNRLLNGLGVELAGERVGYYGED